MGRHNRAMMSRSQVKGELQTVEWKSIRLTSVGDISNNSEQIGLILMKKTK
jgi:hypothetical protein